MNWHEQQPKLSKKEQEEIRRLGGIDEEKYPQWLDEIPYYDKPDHYQRSCANNPNHLKHHESSSVSA